MPRRKGKKKGNKKMSDHSEAHKNGTNNNRTNRPSNFDDLVINVAREIFAEALGQKVAEVLMHSFMTREPSLMNTDADADRVAIFRNLLEESFGDFYVKILQIILEKVCAIAGISYSEFRDKPLKELLREAETAYRTKMSSPLPPNKDASTA